jgi:Meiotically up-regulated gene 113
MRTKQEILDEIKRTAKENGGKPLGALKFESETGIRPYDWQKFFARFGDAQQEAGFAPNQLNSAHTEDFIAEKMIGLMRKLGKFPTHGDLRIEKNSDPEFPHSQSLFDTKERKRMLAARITKWCEEKGGYDDILAFCAPILEKSKKEDSDASDVDQALGEVYLFKHGRYYKIGKTNDTVRRGTELRIQLPEKLDLIHLIKTDDPSGIEAYWHKRFEAKRMNGEWFDLNPADIKAFKRWRHIV